MSGKPNSRDRRRMLQNGGLKAPASAVKPARDRSQLPGFDQHPELAHTAKTPASQVKKTQSKLNTPTKTRTTPSADVLEWDVAEGGQTASRDKNAPDAYEFPADDAADAEQKAAAAAVNPAQLSQPTRQPANRQRLEGLAHFPPRNSAAALTSAAGVSARRRVKNATIPVSRQINFGHGSPADGLQQLGLTAPRLRDVPTSAAPGYSEQWLANAQQGRCKQTGIRTFAVPQKLMSPQNSCPLPAGMVNHGNTCYLNAVLQALLSLKCLGDDLSSSKLQRLSLSSDGVTHALQTCLQHHTGSSAGIDRPSGSSAISPAAVSAAMARLDSRWGLSRQEDAHEFLTALLDALQTEVLTAQASHLKASKKSLPTPTNSNGTTVAHKHIDQQPAATAASPQDQPTASISSGAQHLHDDGQQTTDAATSAAAAGDAGPCLGVSAALDPASRNFTGCLQHTLTCSGCGHVTIVKEQFNHLSLDLPAPGSTLQQSQDLGPSSGIINLLGGYGSPQPIIPELQSLLANFFAAETLEKSCEACGAAAVQHSLQHAVRRLPRVLVVHLKRFQWQVLAGGGAICRKLSTRVKPDWELLLGGVCCRDRPVPPLIAELMPAGLIERAQQAMMQPSEAADTSKPAPSGHKQQNKAVAPAAAAAPAVGSKRSRGADAENNAAVNETDSKDKVLDSKKQQQDKQQDLMTAWGSNRKSRFERMSTLNGQAFHGARHTDLTQIACHPDQQKKRSYAAAAATSSDPMVLDDGHDADVEDGAEGFGGLKRNNSSTALASLEDVAHSKESYDEDEELQRALAESMKMHEAEQRQRSQQPSAAEQEPPAKAARLDDPAVHSSPCAAAAVGDQQPLPEWVVQQHAAGSLKQAPCGSRTAAAAAGKNSLPSTPRSSPKAFQAGSRAGQGCKREPLQPLVDLAGQDNLYDWQPDNDLAQQQTAADDPTPAAVTGGSSGNVGLSGGLAFSDPVAPGAASSGPGTVQQRQQQRVAGGLFDEVPLISAAAAAGGDGGGGGFVPSSPTAAHRPGPLTGTKRFGKVDSSKADNNSNDSSVMHIDDDVGIVGLTEEEQLARAIAESLKDHAPQQQQGGPGSKAAGDSSPVKGLAGIDVANYDYDAALQQALAESAAAAEQQQVGGVDQAIAGTTADEAAAYVAEDQHKDGPHQQDTAAAAAADGAAVDGGSDDAEDDTVLLVQEVSSGGAAADQQQAKPRMPLVRLVEDSDCEDEPQSSTTHPEQQQQQPPIEPSAVQGQQSAANGGVGAAANTGRTSAGSSHAAQAAMYGKENAEKQQQQQQDASSKPKAKRRPLGEILTNKNVNSSAAGSALDPPVKQPGLAAAVAAAEAAAAGSAAAGSSGLAAAEAAAAAEAVGNWPQQSAANYRLRAVVRHKGPLASSGHFVSDVKSNMQDGMWFHYDDSYVQPTSFANVVQNCQQDGYLYFYVNAAILPVQHPPKAGSKR